MGDNYLSYQEDAFKRDFKGNSIRSDSRYSEVGETSVPQLLDSKRKKPRIYRIWRPVLVDESSAVSTPTKHSHSQAVRISDTNVNTRESHGGDKESELPQIKQKLGKFSKNTISKLASIQEALQRMKQKNEQELSAVLTADPPKGLCINPALHQTLKMKFDGHNKPVARSICGSPILYKDFKDSISKKREYMKKQETMKII